MQGNRDERTAKAEGVGILLLMAIVALVVHMWPRPAPGPVPTPSPRPSELTITSAPASTPPSAPEPVRPRPRRGIPVRRAPSMPEPAVEPAHDLPPLVPPPPSPDLTAISHLPGNDIDIRPAVPQSVTEPDAGSSGNARHPGAMTRAATSTGKALAVAFRKTGAAVRRVF